MFGVGALICAHVVFGIAQKQSDVLFSLHAKLQKYQFLEGHERLSTLHGCALRRRPTRLIHSFATSPDFLLRYGAVFVAGIKDNRYRILLYGGTGRYPNTVRPLLVTYVLGIEAMQVWNFNSVDSVTPLSYFPRSLPDVRKPLSLEILSRLTLTVHGGYLHERV